ncbi:unnamed protein product, partial [marine sediment metagenome]
SANFIPIPPRGGNPSANDICDHGLVLQEYYCNENGQIVAASPYECPNGCEDGACLRILGCTDTDEENNVYIRGIIVDVDENTGTDFCKRSWWNEGTNTWTWARVASCGANTNNNPYSPTNPTGSKEDRCSVNQYGCRIDGKKHFEQNDFCIYGCENGVCIEEESPTCIPCTQSLQIDCPVGTTTADGTGQYTISCVDSCYEYLSEVYCIGLEEGTYVLKDGATGTYTFNGNNYEVEVLYIGTAVGTITTIFNINGENIDPLETNELYP